MTRSLLIMRWGRACLGTLLLTLVTLCASAASPKRVLFIHSFGRDFEPYRTVSGSLRTELASQMAEPLDFLDASLESARFPGSQQEGPLVDYLQAEFARRPLDLVVPIGGPAVQFVQRHRQPLFPETPMLVASDQRLFNLANPTGKNTAVLTTNEPALTVEMILQVLPQTTNVVVVIGNSDLERFWAAEIRRDLQSLTNRVGFVWLNELPFSEMTRRCAELPPGSAIFLPLLCVDAAGVPHLGDHALLKLHEVANAPLFGIWSSQLGRGILGGRLMDLEEYGRKGAEAAARILHGESPGSIKVPPQKAGPPEFDWRELRRWGIREARLPLGSVVRFRQPGLWERYRWQVGGGILFGAVEAALIVGLLINARARKRADKELRESETRLSLAAEAAAVGLWRLDLATRCFWVTKKTQELFAFDADELITFDRFLNLVHPEDRDLVRQAMQQVLEPKGQIEVEYRILQPDGAARWMHSRGRVHSNPAGQLDYLMGVTVDVTPRKQAEEAWRESEARLASAVEVSGLGFYDMRSDPGQIFVDERLRALLGLTFRDNHRVQEFWLEHIHPEDRQRVQEVSGKLIGGELQGVTVEYRYLHPERGTRWFNHVSRAQEKNAAGKVIRRFGVIRDITETKRAQEALLNFSARLISTQEEERARLARELHDDITQRLARLAIDVGRSESGISSQPPDEVGRSVREELIRLSEDVHALCYRLHPSILEDLGLAAALKAEAERFERQGSSAIEFTVQALPDSVSPDAALCLFRVAQEALRNAARHSGARAMKLSLRGLDEGLQLAVQDNGCGFDPAVQRDHPSLGLSSMQERVRLLGGELEIESAPGQGTTVLAWVPLKAAEGHSVQLRNGKT